MHDYYAIATGVTKPLIGVLLTYGNLYSMSFGRFSAPIGQAADAAVRNGFRLDTALLTRAINLADAMDVALTHEPQAVEVNIGPNGSCEFVIQLSKVVLEVTAEPDQDGYDVFIEPRDGGAAEESHFTGAAEVAGVIARYAH